MQEQPNMQAQDVMSQSISTSINQPIIQCANPLVFAQMLYRCCTECLQCMLGPTIMVCDKHPVAKPLDKKKGIIQAATPARDGQKCKSFPDRGIPFTFHALRNVHMGASCFAS